MEGRRKQKAAPLGGSSSSGNYLLWTLLFTVAGILTRFYRIAAGNRTIWDEAHFGKFGSYYIKRQFYSDVHPPIGKMLIGLIGHLFGYDGQFSFGSGNRYKDLVPYVQMRMAVSLFGSLTVPMAFLTATQLGLSLMASLLVGLMFLLDTGFIGIERIILLDPFLLFFIMLTTLCFAVFTNPKIAPFGKRWFLSLFGTGLGLGGSLGVKMVGLLTIAFVGVLTLKQLWDMLENRRVPAKTYCAHFFLRGLFLIVLPSFIYAFSFVFHFAILSRAGSADESMGSLFQAGLSGNRLNDAPRQLGYGSKVTFRANRSGGGLLHSHIQKYPEGSQEQQVTTYGHGDDNNNWILYPENGSDSLSDTAEILEIKDGDSIRLFHPQTKGFLRTNTFHAPLSLDKKEVSCTNDCSDGSCVWIVEVTGGPKKVEALSTQFYLRNKKTGTALEVTGKQLPKWGFDQGEVAANLDPACTGKSLEWNVEGNFDPRANSKSSAEPKYAFWRFFIDQNAIMLRSNNSLVPSKELEPGLITSTPFQWPFLFKGIRMSSWDKEKDKFYMLGNPFVWWTSSVAILLLWALAIAFFIARKHTPELFQDKGWSFFARGALFCLLGWAFHYLPFFLFGRVLYLHHYFPALIYAVLSVGLLFDVLVQDSRLRSVFFSVGVVLTISAFIFFAPVCYGLEGPSAAFSNSRMWREHWNL